MNRNKNKPSCVFPIKRDGKIYRYMVRTYINRERHYVGCFKTQEAASIALNKYLERQQAKAEALRRM